MRVEIFRNFLDAETIAELNAWTVLGVENGWLDDGISNYRYGYSLRKTSRIYSQRFEYPQIVRDVSERIRAFCGLSQYPLITGHGRDGVVVSYTLPGGDVYRHRDPAGAMGLATLRCNVMTQAADAGGILHIEGKRIDIEVGDLHCYLVSEFAHSATTVEGNTPRIMWMFGAHVPADKWESGAIAIGA